MTDINVHSLLEAIRARPAMYLGEPSLTLLRSFLDGSTFALDEHQIPFKRIGLWRPITKELFYFHGWVTKKLGFGNLSYGYSQAILKHTDGDEVAALALFWELLDE